MTKFVFDPRAGMMVPKQDRVTDQEVLLKAGRVLHKEIMLLKLTELDVKNIIKDIRSGTVNIHYLVKKCPSTNSTVLRLYYKSICEFLLRELTN